IDRAGQPHLAPRFDLGRQRRRRALEHRALPAVLPGGGALPQRRQRDAERSHADHRVNAMNLRVSQNQLYTLLTTHWRDIFARLAHLQEQVSSGKRILRPSDDPTGSSLALALHVRDAEIDGWSKTANTARTRVDEATSLVQQASDALGSARELTIQGMSTALGANARAILATQVDQLREQMLQLANTQYDGEYLFGGTNTTVAPVTQTGAGDT